MRFLVVVCAVLGVFMLTGCETIVSTGPDWSNHDYSHLDPNDYYYQQDGSFYHHHHSRQVDIVVREVPLGYFIAPRPIHINRPPVIHFPNSPRHEIHSNHHSNRPSLFYLPTRPHPSGPPMIHNRSQLRRPEINIPSSRPAPIIEHQPSIRVPNVGRPSAPLMRPPIGSGRHQMSPPNFGGQSRHNGPFRIPSHK